MGVALVEAAAAGCSLITSRFVGSADHVLTEMNGILLSEIDSESICHALLESDGWDKQQIALAGKVSTTLASKYTPQQWSNRLLHIQEFLTTYD